MKEILKNSPIKFAAIIARTFKIKPGFLARVRALTSYFVDYRAYLDIDTNTTFKLSSADLFPRIYDKTTDHGLDPVYFIQGTWCARKIFEAKPKRHVDIASQALMVGIIAQSVPTTMVGIRPLEISIPGLSFIQGDITRLPFKDNEIESLSSICVIEHIGLGRYGDSLDQFGTEKAAKELCRVLAIRGSLYISVPVDSASKVYFNAHRAFTREHALSLFKGLELIEESYIYGRTVQNLYDPLKGFGTGLYHFKK